MPSAVPVRPKANRLFIAGAALLCLMLGLGGLAAWRYAAAEKWVEHSLAVQRELDGWTMVMGELQSTTRAYVASANPELLSGHAGLVLAERTQAGKVRRLVEDNLPQREVVTRANRHAELAVSYFEQQLARVQSGRHAEAMERLTRGEGRDLVDQFRAAARSVRAEENRLLEQQRRAAAESARATLLGAFLVAATAVALLGFAWRRELQHDAVVTDMARSARGRLRLLADLASALAATRTVAQVADVVVEHGMRAAGGDTCTLYALNAESDALELIAQHGVAPNLIEKIRVISAQQGNPETYRSVRERRSVWAESMADYAVLYPTLAATKVEGPRAQAFWSVPLIAEDQALGLLGVGFFSPRKFTQDERAFVDTLAHQCAQALLRAKRTQAEEEARRWFSTTLRSIGDAVIATDEHGKIQFINPVAERLTGYDEAQALGRPLEAVFHIISEHSRAVVESPVTKVLREGKIVGLANHTVLLPRQGPEVPIDDSGSTTAAPRSATKPVRSWAWSWCSVTFRPRSGKRRATPSWSRLARRWSRPWTTRQHFRPWRG
jgi:PAS domain S-box-containing protein